jgi:hypothetical protein
MRKFSVRQDPIITRPNSPARWMKRIGYFLNPYSRATNFKAPGARLSDPPFLTNKSHHVEAL